MLDLSSTPRAYISGHIPSSSSGTRMVVSHRLELRASVLCFSRFDLDAKKDHRVGNLWWFPSPDYINQMLLALLRLSGKNMGSSKCIQLQLVTQWATCVCQDWPQHHTVVLGFSEEPCDNTEVLMYSLLRTPSSSRWAANLKKILFSAVSSKMILNWLNKEFTLNINIIEKQSVDCKVNELSKNEWLI